MHDYLQVCVDGEWIDVDATWPLALRDFGLPATEDWDGKTSMVLSVVSDEHEELDGDPAKAKEERLSKLTPRQRMLRKQFLETLSQWAGRAPGGGGAGPLMSSAELVDVVDAQDRVVGRASRGEVRARRLRHRATYLLVFNGRGELFIHLRTADKDIYPSYWDVAVGGVVGAGESYDDGARRELAEEVGIRDAVPEALFDFAHEDERNCVNGRVYASSGRAPGAAGGGNRARRMAAARRRPRAHAARAVLPGRRRGVRALPRADALRRRRQSMRSAS